MKKNLILFLGCILLATFTYFFQERKDREEIEEKNQKEQLLTDQSFGELKGFSLRDIVIKKDGESWRLADGEAASSENIETFFDVLSRVKVIRRLSKEDIKDKNFFKQFGKFEMTFSFENKKLLFSIGEKLQFSRGFYAKISSDDHTQYLIASYTKPDLVYSKEQEKMTDIPYKELVSLFGLNKDFFRSLRLEELLTLETISSVGLKDRVARDVSLSFEAQSLEPSQPEDKKINVEFIKNELLNLLSLRAKRSFDYKEDQLASLRGRLVLNDSVVLTLFSQYGGKEGYFVQVSDYSRILEYNATDVKFFFTPFQEFYY